MLGGSKTGDGECGLIRNGISVPFNTGKAVALAGFLDIQGNAAGYRQRTQVKGDKAPLYPLGIGFGQVFKLFPDQFPPG